MLNAVIHRSRHACILYVAMIYTYNHKKGSFINYLPKRSYVEGTVVTLLELGLTKLCGDGNNRVQFFFIQTITY